MLHKLLKGLAPVAALAAAFTVAGCDADISINGDKGVPLAELDLEGKRPTELVLAGPDTVVVTQGDALKIEVTGDPQAVEALRFTLDDEALGIMRAKDSGKIEGKARVAVTFPELREVVVAGSGTVEAAALAGNAEITIAGSGTARTQSVDATALEVTIAGSGTYQASGRSEALELTIAGSGSAEMAGLSVETAEVTIAGSGSAGFASNGTVTATVMGSGEVTVAGNAKCTITSMGSGKLHCNPANTTTTTAGVPPAAPTAPQAPDLPTPPQAPVPPDAPQTPE